MRLPILPITNLFSVEGVGAGGIVGAIASQTWGTANLAVLWPLTLESPAKFVKAVIVNGTAAGNVDVGIYDSAFNRLVSHGGTAQTGSNQIQEFDWTDTWFAPGQYWVAMAASSTSTAVYVASAVDEIILSAFPILEATTSYPLPSTISAVKNTRSSPLVPVIGLSKVSTI